MPIRVGLALVVTASILLAEEASAQKSADETDTGEPTAPPGTILAPSRLLKNLGSGIDTI